ncbi:hypothetical protein KOW79_019044 [Hemibagrus wyckioides]|uniref:Uncharacterized protein n=1 Tax=Hemibagrus wyckioides TaxID=337641 RepID=A0A9D3N8T4_9TELE|nr:hypothetical protein KOW79_019044 [Hemibagrus wyckioides]
MSELLSRHFRTSLVIVGARGEELHQKFLPPTGGGLVLNGVHLQHPSFFWLASTHVLEVSDDHSSLSLCSPTDPPPLLPPLLSPLPFHTPPANGLPCPSPAIPLSIPASEAVWGEERRETRGEEKERRQQPTVPLGLCLTAAPLA